MHHTASIALFEHAQPHSRVWRIGVEYASTWNRSHASQFVSYFDRHLNLSFEDRAAPECQEALADLEALECQHGLVWDVLYGVVYSEADFDAAPLVGMYGAGVVERPGGPLIVNAAEAFGKPRACAGCKRAASLPPAQLAELVVDESYLDGPATAGLGKEPIVGVSWDVLTPPQGHLLVSTRVLESLRAAGVEGWRTRPVRESTTGRRSERAVQLLPLRTLPEPHREHTTLRGGWMCPVCGFFDGQLEGEVRLRREVLGESEVFSSWGDTLPIYLTQRVYRALREAGMTGLSPGNIIRLVGSQ